MWPAVPMTTFFMTLSASARADGLAAGALALARAIRTHALALGPGLAATCAAAAFVLAERVEHVDQSEVDLPALHVHAHHLNSHAVAEPVDLVGVLTAQGVGRFQKAIVVVGHA